MKPALHILSLPHGRQTKEFSFCAYSQKVRRFCNMMTSLGYETYLYGSQHNEADVTELIVTTTTEDCQEWWGVDQWPNDRMFAGEDWNSYQPWWQVTNKRAIDEISKRIKPEDIICVIAGHAQKMVSDAFPDNQTCEWGIGYSGVFSQFKVYESNAWRMHVDGLRGIDDVNFYDTVIPNSWALDEFSYVDESDDYFLYMGRLTKRKGIPIIQEMINRGVKVKYAGQQGDVDFEGAEYLGVLSGEEKANVIARAKAVLVPSTYCEPFGGISIEAGMSGVPVITTNYGVFPETIIEGVTGYRCDTLNEFMQATEDIETLSKMTIKQLIRAKYDVEVVKYQYDKYFSKLNGLFHAGEDWYGSYPVVRL